MQIKFSLYVHMHVGRQNVDVLFQSSDTRVLVCGLN